MRIGLTYDLKEDWIRQGLGAEEAAEFDSPVTIEAIARVMGELGHEPFRIGGLRALVTRLAAGERWDLVFNIAEGRHGFGRESQVPALLDAYRIPYTFSDPLACAVTLHKPTAKHVLRDQGIPTPAFAVVKTLDDLGRVDLPLPLFAKPVAEGTSKGVGPDAKITARAQLEPVCARLLARLRQPVLLETFLPGREVTVGIVGTGVKARALGTLEVLLLSGAEPEIYSYQNKQDWQGKIDYRLADGPFAAEAERLAVEAWRALDCRDGGRVDLRADARGRLHVLELNPLPGLNPELSDLPILCQRRGIDYRQLLGWIVDSACERVGAGAAEAGC